MTAPELEDGGSIFAHGEKHFLSFYLSCLLSLPVASVSDYLFVREKRNTNTLLHHY